jgi:hypothetical protein
MPLSPVNKGALADCSYYNAPHGCNANHFSIQNEILYGQSRLHPGPVKRKAIYNVVPLSWSLFMWFPGGNHGGNSKIILYGHLKSGAVQEVQYNNTFGTTLSFYLHINKTD